MSTTKPSAAQARAHNLFKIVKQQHAEVNQLERQPDLSVADREEAATLHEHIAMSYQALAEVYPFAAKLWNGLASREYGKAARHQVAMFYSTAEPVAEVEEVLAA
ncbi:hypothetical protein [Saccharopolyspora taberi]|uniref:Uncharacterized protein n=1 Tax=Saccharopolyspora taberi TaxID=60895 RepID=A0ABN3VEZ1_9PSEU